MKRHEDRQLNRLQVVGGGGACSSDVVNLHRSIILPSTSINFLDNYQRHEVEQCPTNLSELAIDSAKFAYP